MGLTSTTIIREYIEKNVAEFDRTILEKKDEYRGCLLYTSDAADE